MEHRFGVVVVGCGYMGRIHLEGIADHAQAELIGVVDAVETRARNAAELFGVASWSCNCDRYLFDPRVDIAVICTYPSSHFAIAKAFMDRGIAVICEKPMASNIIEAQEFYDYAMASKAKIIFGHILRYNHTYQLVHDMLREGAIGSPLVMRLSQLKRVTHSADTYINLLDRSSPIIDCGVHYLDVMRWFTGADAVSFSGVGQCLDKELAVGTYNYGITTIRFSDGSVGYYEAGWGRSLQNDNTKEFIGPEGRIQMIYQVHRTEGNERGNLVLYQRRGEDRPQAIDVPFLSKPTGEQFGYFARMLTQNIDHRPFLQDVFRAMQEAILAHRAICENRTFYTLDGCKHIQWDK